jgi:hypothetical protein
MGNTNRHPNGTHATEAIKNLTEALTDEIIGAANANGSDIHETETRTALRKELASLGVAIAKTSFSQKTELLKKIGAAKEMTIRS